MCNRCRRRAMDFKNLSRNDLAFIKLASIRLMLKKLSNSAWDFSDGSYGSGAERFEAQ